MCHFVCICTCKCVWVFVLVYTRPPDGHALEYYYHPISALAHTRGRHNQTDTRRTRHTQHTDQGRHTHTHINHITHTHHTTVHYAHARTRIHTCTHTHAPGHPFTRKRRGIGLAYVEGAAVLRDSVGPVTFSPPSFFRHGFLDNQRGSGTM